MRVGGQRIPGVRSRTLAKLSKGGISRDCVTVIAVDPDRRGFYISELRGMSRVNGLCRYQVEDLDWGCGSTLR